MVFRRLRRHRRSRQPAVSLAEPRETAPLTSDRLRRMAAREDADLVNNALPYAISDDDAEERFERYRESDPLQEIPPALLNSADIAAYVEKTGLMFPFHPHKLKSASYEAGILGPYLQVGPDGEEFTGTIAKGEKFILKANTITFATVQPYFRLPDYIALRHNLKISHIYKGLLVGTGPLIDPGFVGQIALPIHNLTNNNYTITGGDGIIWIEFTKLSPNRNWDSTTTLQPSRGAYKSFDEEKSRNSDVRTYVIKAVDGRPFPSSSNAMIDATAQDALAAAQGTANLVAKRFKQFTWIGISSAAALLIGVVGTWLTLISPLTDQARYGDEQQSEINDQQKIIEEQSERIEELQEDLERLERLTAPDQ